MDGHSGLSSGRILIESVAKSPPTLNVPASQFLPTNLSLDTWVYIFMNYAVFEIEPSSMLWSFFSYYQFSTKCDFSVLTIVLLWFFIKNILEKQKCFIGVCLSLGYCNKVPETG